MLTDHCYNSKADIWSLGILCYELLCGFFPFEIQNYNDTMDNIKNQKPKEYPENLPQ